MQKDFKIGLGIGVIFAVGVVLWLATLPNLSARARALQAASGLDRKNYQPAQRQIESFSSNPSPQTPPYVSPPASSPQSTDGTPTSSIENRVSPAQSVVEGSNEQPTTNNEQPQRIHIVQRGDTLSAISAKYYGSARQWRKILAANRDILPDPNRLIPGTKLLIPQ